jgi:hypothetical protein
MPKTRDDARRDLTLLVIGLTSWPEGTGRGCWKNFDFVTMDELRGAGLIEGSPRSKSIWLTPDGIATVERLAREYEIDDPLGAAATPGIEQLQLHIQLEEVEPVVWRRLVVPLSATGRQLHRAIQHAFGWEDRHLHEFDVEGQHFGNNIEEPEPGFKPSSALKLKRAWEQSVREFSYAYDFGDNWQCRIRLEAQAAGLSESRYAVLDGAEPAPPEDSGGPHSYMEMRERAAAPKTDDDRELATWLQEFPPDPFVLGTINARLRTMK